MPPDEVAAQIQPAHQDQQGSPLHAALARTTTRAIALYFSRPVRLFRPSKAVGTPSEGMLIGTVLFSIPNTLFPSLRVKFMVIPKHFVPPILANAALGTVLWTTYTECSGYLQPHFGLHSIFTVILSGAAAGGMQALVAAPVENARLVIEGGTGKDWSHAWKEVFRGTQPVRTLSRSDEIRDIRQLRLWMKDVTEMAGRGWTGWGWGLGKDVCGFAAFFTIFEITRKVAYEVKLATLATHLSFRRSQSENETLHTSHLSRFTHAFTLVCGGMMAGLAYESLCRPWDVARHVINLEKSRQSGQQSSFSIVMQKLQVDGIRSFFREHSTGYQELRTNTRRGIYSALRTLGRVGPWGMGFLVWESFGPGLD